MHLELSILNGSGYISTFSDDGSSLCCKPVSDDIEQLAIGLSKNKTLCVQQASDGQTYIVSERKNMSNTVVELVKEQSEAAKSCGDSKSKVEFSRYKQDCRKMALEIAIEKQWSKAGKKHSLELADELYTWLITIPQ